MMQLGFVTAILPELSFKEVLEFAAETGYDCVEVMCWPKGKAERRYAGVTHIDVMDVTDQDAAAIHTLVKETGVAISALGYYPNPLTADLEASALYVAHLKRVIDASKMLGLSGMNTFVGRDPQKSVDENWPRFKEVWTDIIAYAEQQGVKVGIENCPMLFTYDEWPGGKNLAITPEIWERMFEELHSECFGLNYDPSHMIWQHMDYLAPMREFAHKLFHVHAKDVRIDRHKLDRVGITAPPNQWHSPKLPGLGEVDWGRFFSTLTSVGYQGPVCVEVEDRAYEGSLEDRKTALRQSHAYLRQFIA